MEPRGIAGVSHSDHFTLPPVGAMCWNRVEVIASLTYLADHTKRVRFGPMVAPLSFRDPVMLARQAVTLDDLSGGQMVLGRGSAWREKEHERFGYELGNVLTRMARLEEGHHGGHGGASGIRE